MVKRSFTLIELLISIILFSIILVFVYEVLHTTKNHNEKYQSQIDQIINKYDLEFVFFKDMLNILDSKTLKIETDRDKNGIITLQTANNYHNPFYTHISYFLNKENQIMRIESKNKFDKNRIEQSIEESYIDIVAKDIKQFKIEQSKNKKVYLFYLEKLNGSSIYFPIKID